MVALTSWHAVVDTEEQIVTEIKAWRSKSDRSGENRGRRGGKRGSRRDGSPGFLNMDTIKSILHGGIGWEKQ